MCPAVSSRCYRDALDNEELTARISGRPRHERPDAPGFEEFAKKVSAFAAARDWSRFHSPKNLAMALSVEVFELAELFQRLTETESDSLDAVARQRATDVSNQSLSVTATTSLMPIVNGLSGTASDVPESR